MGPVRYPAVPYCTVPYYYTLLLHLIVLDYTVLYCTVLKPRVLYPTVLYVSVVRRCCRALRLGISTSNGQPFLLPLPQSRRSTVHKGHISPLRLPKQLTTHITKQKCCLLTHVLLCYQGFVVVAAHLRGGGGGVTFLLSYTAVLVLCIETSPSPGSH